MDGFFNLLRIQDLKQGLEEKETEMKQAVHLAEELIENNKGDKKDEGAQQLQKLKSSTTDLKVRLDSVSVIPAILKPV